MDSLRFSLKAPWAFSALCPSPPSSSAQIPLPIHLVYVQTYLETYMKYHFLFFSWWSLTQPDPAPARKYVSNTGPYTAERRGASVVSPGSPCMAGARLTLFPSHAPRVEHTLSLNYETQPVEKDYSRG